MTDANLTHLYFLLDRSGSMVSLREDTIGGFDTFIAEQRTAPGRCRVTLAQFDNEYDEVYADRDIATSPRSCSSRAARPPCSTRSAGWSSTAGERLAALPEQDRPGSVIVGVMTDGYENASRDWTHGRIKALIEQQSTRYGWQFLYLGADQDAIEEGAKMGFAAGKSMTYSRGKARDAIGHLSKNVGSYREAVAAGAAPMAAQALTDFRQEQRDDAV